MRSSRMFSASIAIVFALLLPSSTPATAQGLVSTKQELDAGRQADAEIVKKYKISRDSYYNGIVSHLGKRLVKVSERSNIDWTFRVIDSKDLNAFSVPGYVYVNTATIDSAGEDQDELAGVIAHEIGHTTGRHAAKQMEKSAIGGLLVGLLGGRNSSVQGLASVAANLVMLGYSRDDENDADKRAVRYLVRAGYDPNGLVRFFEMLQAKGDKSSAGIASYLRTHPPTPDRIKRVKQNIEKERASEGDDSRE